MFIFKWDMRNISTRLLLLFSQTKEQNYLAVYGLSSKYLSFLFFSFFFLGGGVSGVELSEPARHFC